MIDEDRTLQLYGYTSNELKPHSRKPVVAVCDQCLSSRIRRMDGHGDLCRSCAQKGNKKPLGCVRSPETRKKISAAQTGERGNNWKGGLTTWRQRVHYSPVYKNWRAAVFDRDDYTCQMCDTRGGKLEAHHIRPIRDHKNDLSMFDIDNGITLCKKCHKSIFNREHDFIEQFESKTRSG